MALLQLQKTKGILSEYEKRRLLYEQFANKTCTLLKEMVDQKKIRIHSITPRAKDVESLAKKLALKGKKYKSIADVTDLAGVRVTCFTPDQVEEVARIVGSVLKVLPKFSVDKRVPEDPTEFGYSSLHYVAEIEGSRRRLPDWKKFGKLRVEIQIRTILQHAWAEIEHDLGYKTVQEIPREIRRRFSRLSGLLELADDEFNRIRLNIMSYRKKIAKDLRTKAKEVLVDKESLSTYYESSAFLHELDSHIARLTKANLNGQVDPEMVEGDLNLAVYHKVKTVEALQILLTKHRVRILGLVEKWPAVPTGGTVRRGISVFYLGLLLAGSQGKEKIEGYIEEFPITVGGEKTIPELADEICKAIGKVLDGSGHEP